MKNLTTFDVLIVYTESLATSASSCGLEDTLPFSKGSSDESYSIVYGYFLEICEKFDLTAAFTTSADVIGAGTCSSYWIFRNKKWLKYNSPCFSKLIFDKFSPTRKRIKARRDLLFSSKEIKPFNDPELFDLFFDKQKTYDRLSQFAIPTVSLEEKTMEGVVASCDNLKQMMEEHQYSKDFGDQIVLKDRFGAGGKHVYKFRIDQSEKILAAIQRNRKLNFIIQPLVDFDRGFSYNGTTSSTDIRLIYLNGKISQSYIRVAKPGNFRCNEHQGGLLTYLSLGELPKKLIKQANVVAEILSAEGSLFAIDFIVSNNGNVYLLEGNTGPGLDWNMSLKINEIEAKKLIWLIIKELVVRAEANVVIESEDERLGSIVGSAQVVFAI